MPDLDDREPGSQHSSPSFTVGAYPQALIPCRWVIFRLARRFLSSTGGGVRLHHGGEFSSVGPDARGAPASMWSSRFDRPRGKRQPAAPNRPSHEGGADRSASSAPIRSQGGTSHFLLRDADRSKRVPPAQATGRDRSLFSYGMRAARNEFRSPRPQGRTSHFSQEEASRSAAQVQTAMISRAAGETLSVCGPSTSREGPTL